MISRMVSGVVLLSAVSLLGATSVRAQCCADDVACIPTNAPKTASAPEKVIKVQTTCPVMGGAIDKASFVDYEGKRIYMCCKGCTAALKKDPAKYIKILEDTGVTLDATPKVDKK